MRLRRAVTSLGTVFIEKFVTPAEAGVQRICSRHQSLDSGLRRNDVGGIFSTPWVSRRDCVVAAVSVLMPTYGMILIAALLIGLPCILAAQDGPPVQARSRIPIYDYRVLHVYPHDRKAYTQGLIFSGGFLYESTGLNGASGVRKVSLKSGRVLQERRLAREHFGEGLTEWGDRLVQLTWQSNTGFIYDRSTLNVQGTFGYPGEGWGLTHDGVRLIMSDGTDTLRFLDPWTFKETGRLRVHDGGAPVRLLNELEFVRGEIFANVFMTNWIARISPETGAVTGWIDLSGLLSEADRRIPVDVLNGIAYDAAGKRLFVTGKFWPRLFEIELALRREQKAQ